MKTIDLEIEVFLTPYEGEESVHRSLESYNVPDCLDYIIFQHYLHNVGRNEKLRVDDVELLIQLLIRAEANGYDINDLLLVALLAGKRQVIYEHHLKKQQPA